MKKPWMIGLLSVVPGLGLVVLGKVRAGLGAFILTLLLFACLFVPWEMVSATGLAFGLIAWGLQWYYALVVAQRLACAEAGLALPVRQAAPVTPAPSDATSGERLLHKARQTVMPLLLPDEHLRIAIRGATGVPSLASNLLNLALGTVPDAGVIRQVYLGITEHDFIFIKTDPFGMLAELQRIPLDQVALAESREGLLSDEFAIDIGEAEPLSVQVSRQIRQGTQQLLGALSGEGHDRSEADVPVRQDRVFAAGNRWTTPSPTTGQGFLSKHPILVYALLGISGGIVGTVAAALLSIVVSVFFGDALAGKTLPSDFGEGLGILIGLYCLIMFPVGGALVGVIPGAIVGVLRISQARELALLPPLLAGCMAVVLFTLGSLVAVLAAF